MKRFTIIFTILLTLGFAGALAYVGMSEDFVEPGGGLVGEGEDPNAPIWSMTLDEVLAELEGQGLIDTSGQISLAAGGLCTDAVKVSNGAEFYWWDLGTLNEDSAEYKAYKQLKEEGVIDLYGSGHIIMPVPNGPFALLLSLCEGDVDALDKAFRAVGQTGGASAEDRGAPIWNMTMDELLAELEGQGVIETTDLITLAADGISTAAVKVTNGAEIFWWDLDNLDENAMEYEAYKQMKEEGVINFYGAGRDIMPFTANGPFGLMMVYCEDDTDTLENAFKAIGQAE